MWSVFVTPQDETFPTWNEWMNEWEQNLLVKTFTDFHIFAQICMSKAWEAAGRDSVFLHLHVKGKPWQTCVCVCLCVSLCATMVVKVCCFLVVFLDIVNIVLLIQYLLIDIVLFDFHETWSLSVRTFLHIHTSAQLHVEICKRPFSYVFFL